jgi:hypothetical protein
MMPGLVSDRGVRERGASVVEAMWVLLVAALAVAVAIPTVLHTTSASADVDARANLQLAMVVAKATYEVEQTYSWNGTALPTISFAAQGPEFSWTTGSCAGGDPSCASEQVLDVNSAGDGQGVAVAVWSSTTGTCWYGLDLETVPRQLVGDHRGVPFESEARASGSVGAVTFAGIYVAHSGVNVRSCIASSAVTAPHLTWTPEEF